MKKKAYVKAALRRDTLLKHVAGRYVRLDARTNLRHAPKELAAFTKAFEAGVKKARSARSAAELSLFDPPLSGSVHKRKSA